MRKSTTNSVNLAVLSMFAVSPFLGYLCLTYLHKGFTTVSIPFLVLAAVITLLLRKNLNITKPAITMFAFAVFCFISDGFIANKEYSMSYFLTNDLMGSLLVLFIIDNTYFSEEYIKKIFDISVVILFIAFVVIIIQSFVNLTFFVEPDEATSLRLSPAWNTRLPSIYTWIGPLWILSLVFFLYWP